MIQNTYAAAALLAVATVFVVAAGKARADDTVVTSSNESAGNAVLQFQQTDDDTLSFVARYATGGIGTDGGLGNQGAIATDGEFLIVVNAGSDDISALRIENGSLTLTGTISSGGFLPVSLIVDRGVVYVLNAGSDNIAGFRIDTHGQFTAIGGSSRPLSTTATGPAQISFSNDGRVLIVTEKATNTIITFPVERDGIAGPGRAFASPGQTPFGFAFTKGRRVLVSEATAGSIGGLPDRANGPGLLSSDRNRCRIGPLSAELNPAKLTGERRQAASPRQPQRHAVSDRPETRCPAVRSV